MAMTDGAVSSQDVQERPAQGKSRLKPVQSSPAKPMIRGLMTVKEGQFIGQCCLNGFKATEACRQLGFGGKHPDKAAHRFMARTHVRAEFEKRANALTDKVEITVERIAAAYAKLAFAQHDGPLTASNVIQALDALGKHKGMFKPDQVTVVPVTFQFIGGPDLALDVTPKPSTEALASTSMADTDGTGIGKPTPR